MATTVKHAPPASHREELASVRPHMARASVQPQVDTSSLRELAAEAIRATSGKARAAAIDLGIHEASLSRQLKDGTLRLEQLERLGPELLAELGRELVEHFGPLATPKARAHQRIRDARAILDELDQVVELIA